MAEQLLLVWCVGGPGITLVVRLEKPCLECLLLSEGAKVKFPKPMMGPLLTSVG